MEPIIHFLLVFIAVFISNMYTEKRVRKKVEDEYRNAAIRKIKE